MLTPAMARARHRQPSGWRRVVRVGLALVCALAALVAIKALVHDVRVDRALSRRGVAATGHLLDTHCRLCRAVGVTYTETDGVAVSTVVSAIGPQDNATIALKYDPKQPSVVHPARGVVEAELLAAMVFAVGLFIALRCFGLPRRRRGHRPRVRPTGRTSYDMKGHVRVVRD